jgi:hypothetical protein
MAIPRPPIGSTTTRLSTLVVTSTRIRRLVPPAVAVAQVHTAGWTSLWALTQEAAFVARRRPRDSMETGLLTG